MADVITTDATLRGLIRTARRNARLSQKEAAQRAGCSPSWWRRVESAYETKVAPEMMADMLDAVDVTPAHLLSIDRPILADLVAARQAFRSVGDEQDLEDYLMNAPAPEVLRHELVAFALARTQKILKYRPEPFADQFMPER